MPYRRKDSTVWWASYVDASGQRVRRPTGATSWIEAKAIEAKWRAETHGQKWWGRPPTRTFEEVMLTYLKHTQGEKRSARADRIRTANLRNVFSGQEMNTLSRADIRRYIERRQAAGKAAGTINRELALLSAAINHCNREWGENLPNPVKGVRLKEPEGRTRWLTPDQIERLLEAAKSSRAPHLVDWIQLALNTGMRSGELLGLEWSRVDLQAGVIRLQATHTKGAKKRNVPLNQGARQAIMNRLRFRAQHCPTSPWVFAWKTGERVRSIKEAFTAACKRVGLEDFHPHDLRHTCAALLVCAGATLAEIRDLLGHHSVTMTERYAHLAPENVRAAVSRLDESRSRFGHDVLKQAQ